MKKLTLKIENLPGWVFVAAFFIMTAAAYIALGYFLGYADVLTR